MKKQESKIGVPDVFRAFWRGLRPQKGAAFFTMLAFVVTSTLSVITPIYYKKFFDLLASNGLETTAAFSLIKILLVILGINITSLIIMRTSFFVLNNLESRTMSRLRQMSFDHMIKHSYLFFANSFAGSLVQKVNRFSRSFERLYDTLVFQAIPLTVSVTGSIIVIWLQKALFAQIIIGWIVAIFVFNFFFSRWRLKYDQASAKADSATTAALSDNIANQNTVMLFANASKESEDFAKTSDAQAKAQRLTWNLGNVVDGVQALFMVIVEFLVFYYAIQYWQQGLVTVGTFVLIQAYILNLSSKLWDFGRIIRNVYEAFADSKEMVEILALPHEIRDADNAKLLDVKGGHIEFKDLCFGFNDTKLVLNNLNLSISAGEKVALIGPSGAGKSTIVKTLLRMYDVTSGSILIDGQNIKDVTQDSLRRNISLVPQDPILFHRSLLENIRYGKLEATNEEVIEAAKLAHCDEFIDGLPLKYETLVGERGIKLSGGERQRIAIARAILKNAPVLILDEATSSLDSHSESLIQDALNRLMKGKTSIVIAHRLSTIKQMDRIVVIEDGKVLEEGDHDSLLSKDSGLYKKLWTLQAGGFIKED